MRAPIRFILATAILLFVAARPALAIDPMTASFAIPEAVLIGGAPFVFRGEASNPAGGSDHPSAVIDLVVDPHGLLAPADFVLTLEPDGQPGANVTVAWTVQPDGTWIARLTGPSPIQLPAGFVGGATFTGTIGPAAKHGTIDVSLLITDVDPVTIEPIAAAAEDHHAVGLHLLVEPTADVAPGTVDAGGDITITVDGFQPLAEVTFTLHSAPVVLGTATADQDGSATATFTLPAGVSGLHSIEASGLGLDGTSFSVLREITIAVPPPPTSTADPSPAPPGRSPLVAWLVLVLAIVSALAVWRRRLAGSA